MGRKHKITEFTPKNPGKYSGIIPLKLRSSWEVHLADWFDRNDDVISWAYEPEGIKIPYPDPITGTQKIYIPDFFMSFVDRANSEEKSIMIEVKPSHEASAESARNDQDRLLVARNMAKWASASWWCQRHGVDFRVMTEGNLFMDVPAKSGGVGGARGLKNKGMRKQKTMSGPKRAPRRKRAAPRKPKR